MFREFEKGTEKKTPGGSFFINLCLLSLKKYKTILERTAQPLRSRVLFMIIDLDLKNRKAIETTSFRN